MVRLWERWTNSLLLFPSSSFLHIQKKTGRKKRKKPTSLLWPLFVFFFCCSGPAYAALCSQWETRDAFQLYIRYNQEKWARIICMNGSLQALTFVSFCLFSSQQKYIWRLQSCRTFFLPLFFRYFRLIDRKIDSSTRDSTQQRSVPIIIITEARARGDACAWNFVFSAGIYIIIAIIRFHSYSGSIAAIPAICIRPGFRTQWAARIMSWCQGEWNGCGSSRRIASTTV